MAVKQGHQKCSDGNEYMVLYQDMTWKVAGGFSKEDHLLPYHPPVPQLSLPTAVVRFSLSWPLALSVFSSSALDIPRLSWLSVSWHFHIDISNQTSPSSFTPAGRCYLNVLPVTWASQVPNWAYSLQKLPLLFFPISINDFTIHPVSQVRFLLFSQHSPHLIHHQVPFRAVFIISLEFVSLSCLHLLPATLCLPLTMVSTFLLPSVFSPHCPE